MGRDPVDGGEGRPSSPCGHEDAYRRAEADLWTGSGLAPTERFIELDDPRVRLRVLEVGSGRPLVFIGGTGGTGPYFAPLVAELGGRRHLLVDRPGFALSSPLSFAGRDHGDLVAGVLVGVLDQLGLDRVDVVGASIGDLWALRLAERHPERVDHVVLLGGGPIVDEVAPPRFVRLLASPLGALVVRVPQSPAVSRKQLAGLGHGPSLEAGRFTEAFFRWRQALTTHTPTMRHERELIRAVVEGAGWREGFVLTEDELARVRCPLLLVLGARDPVGSLALWRRVVQQLPHAELHQVDGGGHLPWFDDPVGVARRIERFCRADSYPPG